MPPHAATDLRAEARAGAFWTTLLTVASRLQQTVMQLVLAWLLSPSDFGLIAMATTVMAFAWFLRHAGLGSILIQRQKRFSLWVSPATAMVCLSGAAATLLALAAAAPAARAYGRPELAFIIGLFALSVLPEALRSIAQAKLRADLRFRSLTQLQLLNLALVFALSVGLAWLNFGVYALVIPRVAGGFFGLAAEWAVARPGLRPRRMLRPRRWKHLLGSSVWITLAGLSVQFMNQGDYAVLGFFEDEELVGHYYFAFLLSSQAMMLVTINIGGVLTPVLARMQDRPAEQADRFDEVCRLIALVGFPACFGLALVADPLLRVCFDPRYLPAIPFLQWLSVGMAFRLVGHNGSFLLQANGRWRRYFLLSFANAVLFLAACLVGHTLGGAAGLTAGVTLFYAAFGVSQLAFSGARSERPKAARLARIYTAPLAATAPAYAGLAAIAGALAWPPLVELPLLILAGMASTGLVLRLAFPAAFAAVLEQLPGERWIQRLPRFAAGRQIADNTADPST
ncbi:oligosaccharide flippase family protein [Phycisphaera mikurensis]|uniref:Putative polysaccharide biosynthesis protein n=1 Tax=Phycisphaera mikurensis (strain NBRC 102666 / KCTC 22515 / FYK2301M01) TaxID=1142394 RepID=I0IAD5_PHYMF|nr:oligosaccharide flippase family protein [Phycisphaera mikurensis]MBB6441781.1 O-antigen/teichoic acid export membrane protein [Phycisphaera mikurensis]BAM02223.1 putative polysaccharide biosynthesis protein [Phycisphaera mikurensis NBRC 102666]